MKLILVLGASLLAVEPAVAAQLPPVTVWLDETGHRVAVAYGVARVTKIVELDRDKATLLARANLASYLDRNIISGSVIIKEWRHVGGDQNGGLEIVAVKWSEASARLVATIQTDPGKRGF